jgi:hypothetical protein
MLIILSMAESEIKRIMVQNQLGQIVQETLSWKSPSQERAGGVAQCVGPEFKPQYRKKKKENMSFPGMGTREVGWAQRKEDLRVSKVDVFCIHLRQ